MKETELTKTRGRVALKQYKMELEEQLKQRIGEEYFDDSATASETMMKIQADPRISLFSTIMQKVYDENVLLECFNALSIRSDKIHRHKLPTEDGMRGIIGKYHAIAKKLEKFENNYSMRMLKEELNRSSQQGKYLNYIVGRLREKGLEDNKIVDIYTEVVESTLRLYRRVNEIYYDIKPPQPPKARGKRKLKRLISRSAEDIERMNEPFENQVAQMRAKEEADQIARTTRKRDTFRENLQRGVKEIGLGLNFYRNPNSPVKPPTEFLKREKPNRGAR